MKRLLKSALALATVFFAASCTQEKLQPVGSNTVSFKVEIPEVATKAAAAAVGNDASMINDLVYAVYKTTAASVDEALANWGGTTTFLYAENSVDLRFSDNSTDVVNVELLNDQNHIVLLWAQNADVWVSQHGDAIDLTNITYPSDLEVSAGCADKYAAFSGVKFIAANDKTNTEAIELTRPFAQINIATVKPENYAVVINSTDVTVKAAGDNFNVASQLPAASQDVTYSWAGKVYEEKLSANSQEYDHYLAMGYVFAAGNVSVDYTIVTAGHGTITNTIANVPVAKNYRTNIIGNLLTSDVDYNVVLDKNWEGTTDMEYITADSAEEFAQAVSVPNAYVVVPENTTYVLPDTIAEGVIVVGSEGSVIDFRGKNSNYLKNVTFKNITIKEDDNGYNGVQHSESVAYEDCIIDGSLWSYADEATFTRCIFKNQTDNYPLWIYASAKVTLIECAFETRLNKGVLVYNDGPRAFDVTLKDCTFNATECTKNKAAIQMHTDTGIYGSLVIENCTAVNFFDQSGRGTLWSEVLNNTNPETPSNKFDVIVDGAWIAHAGCTQVANYPNLWTKDGEYYVFDLAGLDALHSYLAQRYQNPFDKVFNIAADIDAEGYTWASLWLETGNNNMGGSVINGHGHTISNLTITGGAMFSGTPNGKFSDVPMTIKDLTIDNADVTAGAHFNAVFWGSTYGDVAFENVIVKNSAIEGNCNVGAFVGGTALENDTIAIVTFKDCAVAESTMIATGSSNPDPTGASGFLGRAFDNTNVKFQGANSVDATIINNNGLVGGKVYGYTTVYGGAFVGTGACDTFTDFAGVEVVKVGDNVYGSFAAAVANAKAGDKIELLSDVTLAAQTTIPAGVTIKGNGKQINGTINAGGDLTIAGHTKVTAFSAGSYDRVITIGEGACLEVTGTGRVTVSYGNKFNITGSIIDAKNADKSAITPSLIVPGGLSFNGNGGNAEFNVTNAYIVLGNTTSKNSGAEGIFNFNFYNSVAEFTNQLLFAIPTNGKTPTFNVNLENSVLTTATKLGLGAPNTTIKLNKSLVNIGSYLRNSGKLELVSGSILNSGSMNFGEHGGHNGITIVDASKFNISTSDNEAYALDGQSVGKIILRNNAEAYVQYFKALTIENDGTCTFTGTEVQ